MTKPAKRPTPKAPAAIVDVDERWATMRLDLNAPATATVAEVRRLLSLIRAAAREREAVAARPGPGRPKAPTSHPIVAEVIRREVARVHAAIRSEWSAIRKADDPAAALAEALRSAWPHRRTDELAREAIKAKLPPRGIAVLYVARIRGLSPRTVKNLPA